MEIHLYQHIFEHETLIQILKKKQNLKKWRSITIFGHFKAIVRQNGYKTVDFGNEVLINQLDA